MVPDREACLALIDDAGVQPPVRRHVLAVERLAARMAERSGEADEALVRAGALLHDVGRAFTHGPDHVPEGVAFLEDRGVDERVVACVARHMGAGVEAEQAQAWGWPTDRSYVPETLEERIVAHADNLTIGEAYGTLADAVQRFEAAGLDEAVLERLRALHAGLREELGVDPDDLARATEPP